MDYLQWIGERLAPSAKFMLMALLYPGIPPPRMPKAFDEHSLKFSKLYKCVNVVGQKTMCNVIRAICEKEDLGEGRVTVKEYCRERLKWSSKDIKSRISKLDQEQFNGDIRNEDFDVPFACKIVNTVLNHVYINLSKNCQNEVQELKMLRNKVCHYYGYMPDDLTSIVSRLKVMFKDIYEGVGIHLKIDFSKNISDVEDSLTEILEAQVRQDDIQTYLEIVAECRKDKTSRMIMDGREDLDLHYKSLQVLNACIWMDEEDYKNFKERKATKFKVEKIFTPLKLDSHDEIQLKHILTVPRPGSEIISPVLILKGLPGSGKSSLCHYLIHDWSMKKNEIDALNTFDLVFLIDVKTVASNRLIDFLQEHNKFSKTCEGFDPSDIIPVLKDLKVLFIIDGYDECGSDAREIIEDIFAKFGDKRIILTTRPEYEQDAAFMANRHCVGYHTIEICGLDDEQRTEFTGCVFRAIETDEEKCRKQNSILSAKLDILGQIVGEHLKLPLNLALLVYFWKEKHDVTKVKSATMLYKKLFELCQSKLNERLRCSKDIEAKELDGILDQLLLYLGHQAWDMLRVDDYTVDKNTYALLEKKCKTKDIDVTEFMSAFLMCNVDENSKTDGYVFEFLHKTQMEYLAARYLAEKVRSKEKSIQDIEEDVEQNDWRPYQEVLRYLTGHLAILSKPELDSSHLLEHTFQHLSRVFDCAKIESNNYDYWWNIYVESRRNGKVADKIAMEKLPKDEWVLDAKQLVSGLRLFANTPVKLKRLKIEIPVDIEPYDIKPFLDVMRELRKKLEKRHNKENQVLVELHLWHHYEHGKDKLSNEFMKMLYPWGRLTGFTGSFGKEEPGREVLKYSNDLKTIRARVNTPAALESLSNGINNIFKTLEDICINLAIPVDVLPKDLQQLKRLPNLELRMTHIGNDDTEWLADVIKQVVGR